jgi:hypothetical protein
VEEALETVCTLHGRRPATAICPHLLEGAGKGWHMLGSGDDERPDAICFDCVAAWDPELSAEEAGIECAIVCSECYDQLRARHDVAGEQR